MLAAGLLCNQLCSVQRLLLGGVAAACSTLILFAPELPFVLQLAYQSISACCITMISYWPLKIRQRLQLTAWYFSLNLLLTGFSVAFSLQSKITSHGIETNNLSVYIYISPSLLIGCVIGVYLCLKLFVLCFATPQKTVPPQALTLVLQDMSLQLNAYYDTGFALRDPFSHRRVILLSLPSIESQLPAAWVRLLKSAQSEDYLSSPDHPSILPLRFLPCRTITGHGLLPAICADKILSAQTSSFAIENILVAFCNEPVFCNGCNALFGADLAVDLIQEKEFHHA